MRESGGEKWSSVEVSGKRQKHLPNSTHADEVQTYSSAHMTNCDALFNVKRQVWKHLYPLSRHLNTHDAIPEIPGTHASATPRPHVIAISKYKLIT